MSKRLLTRPLGRCLGLDVHLDFIEIAICEEGKVFAAGRVPSTPEGLGTLAQSLLASDWVALEVTGSSWEIVKLLKPHVRKIVVVSPGDTGIAQAHAKTDGSTRARWPSCCGRASSRRCGCRRSGSRGCAGAFSVARSCPALTVSWPSAPRSSWPRSATSTASRARARWSPTFNGRLTCRDCSASWQISRSTCSIS